jgi:hypothetical protein
MTIDVIMNSMPPDWRKKWCSSNACACMGCANVSGGLTSKGYKKEDWEEWMRGNK